MAASISSGPRKPMLANSWPFGRKCCLARVDFGQTSLTRRLLMPYRDSLRTSGAGAKDFCAVDYSITRKIFLISAYSLII
jgi:hypothetical protein